MPKAAATGAASANSMETELPLSATRDPPVRSSGTVQPRSLTSGATALAVTTSTPAQSPCLTRSSARTRVTVTCSPSSNSATTEVKKLARRSNGSMSTSFRSVLASAQTKPGSPAPEPTSATKALVGIKPSAGSATTAQFNRWRDQIRGTSRGPINPFSTPVLAKISAKATNPG